jgi:tRNA pseudouridine55 synthase
MENKIYNFRKGEILLVDKPLGWTSFDVVNKLRYPLKRKYNIKRLKVGHAGTLDPLATGLLVICTGKKTKEITGFINDSKVYTGIIKLGATTPSYDLETDVNETYPTEHITQTLIDEVKKQFLGEIKQVPPIFSAKKVDGQRAYNAARKGIEIELKANDITVYELTLELKEDNEVHFYIKSSKGTYIRSLAYDIGKALDSGGHLIKLRRESSGEFDIKNAHSIEHWQTVITDTEIGDLDWC